MEDKIVVVFLMLLFSAWIGIIIWSAGKERQERLRGRKK